MARKTKCLTSGAIFQINVNPEKGTIKAEVNMRKCVIADIDKEEADLLSKLIHNQLELVLRPYFNHNKSRKMK
mgnify:CR=1 FL=1